jgi:hypothetical protein
MIAAKKQQRKRTRVLALAAGTVLTTVAMQAHAATQQYFDVNGTTTGFGITNGATYSWEGAFWGTNSTGTSATNTFVQDGTGFARFYGGTSGQSYTVTVGQVEPMAGMYARTAGVTLTVNQAPSTSGGLQVASVGGQALSGGTVQGFLCAGTLIINAPISGPGGVQQSQSQPLFLYGNNSFAGGFGTTGGQTTNYKANNAFGTGTVTFSGTGAQGMVNNGTAHPVFANTLNFGPLSNGTNAYTNTITNFVGGAASGSSAGTTWSGQVYLAPGFTTTWLQGNATTDTTEFSGPITGDATSSLIIGDSNTARGTIILSGANTLQSKIQLNNAKLRLGAANTIASLSEFHMDGGTLESGPYVHVMPNTALVMFQETVATGITANIDATGGQIQFGESTNIWDWGGVNTLNVIGAIGSLRFGTDVNGLRADQLAQIEFNSDPASLGSGYLTSDGYLVPEPSCALLFIGAPWLLRRRRRHV